VSSNFPLYKTISTDDLIPYARNSRTHSEAQVAKIAASIREFGFLNPIITDGANGIVAGHGRVLAAQKLGLESLPCIEAGYLTDAQRRAYVIADNRLALDAGWDDELLKVELQDLDGQGFDLSLTGFELDELGDFLNEPETTEGLTDEDAVPEAPEQPATVEGDVWILGRHRLMCGDSTSVDAVERLLIGRDYDVCVFDPPYEIENLYFDAMPPPMPGQKLVLFWDFKRFAIAPHAAISSGWEPCYEFIWDCVQSWYTQNRPLQRHKACGIFGDNPTFNTDAAIIHDGKDRGGPRVVSNTRGKSEYKPLNGAKHIATVEAFANTAQTNEHAHGKPIKWIEAIFNGIGGDVYIDFFGGSGTTLIACEKTDRECYVMELDPKYCDVIIKRWQDFTGKAAIHEASGKTYQELSNATQAA